MTKIVIYLNGISRLGSGAVKIEQVPLSPTDYNDINAIVLAYCRHQDITLGRNVGAAKIPSPETITIGTVLFVTDEGNEHRVLAP